MQDKSLADLYRTYKYVVNLEAQLAQAQETIRTMNEKELRLAGIVNAQEETISRLTKPVTAEECWQVIDDFWPLTKEAIRSSVVMARALNNLLCRPRSEGRPIMLSPADKKWLIRLVGTAVYVIISALRFPAQRISSRGTIRFLMGDLFKEKKNVESK